MRSRADLRGSRSPVDTALNTRLVRAGNRRLRQPSRSLARRSTLSILIKSFVDQLRYLPPNARPLASPEDLPPVLLRRVRDLDPRSSWHAWTDELRFWFIAARLRIPQDSSISLLRLKVSFFDLDGRRVAAGDWGLQPDGRWSLQRMIDVPIATARASTSHESVQDRE